jgi:hypothetical protein
MLVARDRVKSPRSWGTDPTSRGSGGNTPLSVSQTRAATPTRTRSPSWIVSAPRSGARASTVRSRSASRFRGRWWRPNDETRNLRFTSYRTANPHLVQEQCWSLQNDEVGSRRWIPPDGSPTVPLRVATTTRETRMVSARGGPRYHVSALRGTRRWHDDTTRASWSCRERLGRRRGSRPAGSPR